MDRAMEIIIKMKIVLLQVIKRSDVEFLRDSRFVNDKKNNKVRLDFDTENYNYDIFDHT